MITLAPADTPHLVVLGEVEAAMAQYVTDMARGGYAAVACSRADGGGVMVTLTSFSDRQMFREVLATLAAKNRRPRFPNSMAGWRRP